MFLNTPAHYCEYSSECSLAYRKVERQNREFLEKFIFEEKCNLVLSGLPFVAVQTTEQQNKPPEKHTTDDENKNAQPEHSLSASTLEHRPAN